MAIEKQINIVVKESGLDEVNKKVNKLENSVESLEDQQRSLSKSMGDSSQSVLDNGGAMGLLNDATGGLAMTVKDAVEASWLFTKSQKAASIMTAIQTTVVGTSTGAFKALRIAVAATGIGLLVIGLGMLVANFDKVSKWANSFGWIKKLGEWMGDLTESITDFIGVTSEAERAMAELTEQADKSLAMNKKFMSEQGDVLNEYTKQKIDAKNRYLEAIKEEGANQKALADRLNRELLAIDKKHNDDLAKTRKEKQEKIDQENKTKAEKEKAERLKKEEEEKKRLEDKIKSDAQKSFEIDQEAKQAMVDITEFKNAEIENRENKEIEAGTNTMARIQGEYEENKKLNEEKIRDEELVRDAKFQIANSVFDLVNMFAKKGSKLAKGVAVAQATMNTYQGVTAALAAPSTVPEPFGQALRIANAATIGVTGLLNVKKILSTNEQGSSSAPSAGGSVPSAPSFNLVQGTGSNQVANSIGKQAPLKAYVVSQDVTTGQGMDRNIVKSASL